jgi:predicted P-loop ATPase
MTDHPPVESYTEDLGRHDDVVVDLGTRRSRRGTVPNVQFAWPETAGNRPRPKSVANWAAFTAHKLLAFRFNKMAQQIECQPRGGVWSAMSDAIENAEWLDLTAHGCDMPATFWRACAAAEAERNAYDPGLDWLAGLPEWDGTCRAADVFVRLGGAPDTELIRAMTIAWLVGAVRRLRHPGCQNDYVLVLEGRQNLGKSSAIRIFSPFEAWTSDCLEVGADPKIVLEQTQGKWLIELAEMSGMGRRDIEKTKAFVTRRTDRARLAYARHSIDVPRRFACFASHNPDASRQYLSDPTGNRRWWPVPILQTINRDALLAERDQIWAEVAAAESDGALSYLEPGLELLANEAQAERVLSDPWDDILDGRANGNAYVTVADVWEAVAPDKNRRDPNVGRRIANAMERIGYLKGSLRTEIGGKVKVFRRADLLSFDMRAEHE